MITFMSHKITKIIVTFIVIISLYIYLCFLFLPKEADDKGFNEYYKSVAIDNESKNSIDILFYGNSDLSSGIVPMQMYKEEGYTSFIRAGNRQTLNAIHRQLKDDLSKQKPKLIVLEVDCFYYPNKTMSKQERYGNILLSPFNYHTRWKSLEVDDFILKNNIKRDYHKGYNYQTTNGNYIYENYMGNYTGSEPIEKSILQKVKKIKKLADKNKIDLLFIAAPSPSSWNMKKHNGIKKLAKDLKVNFVDFNVQLDGFDFDYSNSFSDYGNHLNFVGASNVTKYVTKYIKENYDVPDRRLDNNVKYVSWKKDLEKYDEVYAR